MSGRKSDELTLMQVTQWRLLPLLGGRWTHKVPPISGCTQDPMPFHYSHSNSSMKCLSPWKEASMGPRLFMDGWSTSTQSPSQQGAQDYK